MVPRLRPTTPLTIHHTPRRLPVSNAELRRDNRTPAPLSDEVKDRARKAVAANATDADDLRLLLDALGLLPAGA